MLKLKTVIVFLHLMIGLGAAAGGKDVESPLLKELMKRPSSGLRAGWVFDPLKLPTLSGYVLTQTSVHGATRAFQLDSGKNAVYIRMTVERTTVAARHELLKLAGSSTNMVADQAFDVVDDKLGDVVIKWKQFKASASPRWVFFARGNVAFDVDARFAPVDAEAVAKELDAAVTAEPERKTLDLLGPRDVKLTLEPAKPQKGDKVKAHVTFVRDSKEPCTFNYIAGTPDAPLKGGWLNGKAVLEPDGEVTADGVMTWRAANKGKARIWLTVLDGAGLPARTQVDLTVK